MKLGILNPSQSTIHLDVLRYKACQYYFVTEYFIGELISSFVIKSCIIKKSFPVCAQLSLTWIVDTYVEAYTNNAILDSEVKRHL